MASLGSGPSYPTSAKAVARMKAADDKGAAELAKHHRPKTDEEKFAEDGFYQPSQAEAEWLKRAKIAQPVAATDSAAPKKPAAGEWQAPTDWVNGRPPDHKPKHAGSQEIYKELDAANAKYGQDKMQQALQPISVADLLSNPKRGGDFTESLDNYLASDAKNPVVVKAASATKYKFALLFDAIRKLEAAAIEFVQEIQAGAGRYQAIDTGKLDLFNKDIMEAAKAFRAAHDAIDSGQFGQGWAHVVVGNTFLKSAGADAEALNLHAIEDAKSMETTLRNVQTCCKMALSILGGAGTGAAKLLVVFAGTAMKGAELYSAKEIYHSDTELTVSSIVVDTLLDLGALWLGENFKGFVRTTGKAVVTAVLEEVPPTLRQAAMAELQNVMLTMYKQGFSSVNERYLGAHASEKKTGKDIGEGILIESLKDLNADKMAALLKLALAKK